MNHKITTSFAIAALGLAALAGCAQSSQSTAPAGAPASTSQSASPSSSSSEGALATADSSLGTIVVDAKGLTVYVFDKDTANSGKSVCEGDCLAKWPAVVATSDTPSGDGITGDLGSITRTDGTKQVTLNGWPLYYFAADSAAGDVKGQGVGGVWWAVAPNGDKVAGATSGY
jgi:predicted lipoprotein with Yx(FWY)xxD motif